MEVFAFASQPKAKAKPRRSSTNLLIFNDDTCSQRYNSKILCVKIECTTTKRKKLTKFCPRSSTIPNMCIAFFVSMFVTGLFQRHCSHDSPIDVVFSHFLRCSIPLCFPFLFLRVVRRNVCVCVCVYKFRDPENGSSKTKIVWDWKDDERTVKGKETLVEGFKRC